MKKLLTFALALVMVLSMSVTAFAADNTFAPNDNTGKDTKVTFNVDPTYTVTIPATVELEKKTAADQTVTYEKDLIVSAENVRLLEGKKVQVTISSDFKLTTGASGATYELPYTVTVGNQEINDGNTVVATFTTNTTEKSSTLHFAAANPQYAGNYSDTVTFTISVA